MIIKTPKELTNHPGIACAKAASKKRIKFKDLPETHQKAIMMHMMENAWNLDPRNPQDIEEAIKLYGNKPFFIGELVIDHKLKKAIMSSNEFTHKTFDEWMKWYDKHHTDDTKTTYNEDWIVIINQPSNVSNGIFFEDSLRRFNHRYLAKKKKTIPFIQYIPGVHYSTNSKIMEAAFFSKYNPINTGGRIVPRRLNGIVYHGSNCNRPSGWFDTLNVDDEAAAVWVTPEEAMARHFAEGNRGAKIFFVNKYKLRGMKTAELDQKAYNRISSREDFDSDGRDIRYALADYLSDKGYSAWLVTGAISGKFYEDIAIFSGYESEAEYQGTSFKLKDGSWSEYEYFNDEDEAQESMKKHGLL